MPSFDVVSEINAHELTNAVENAIRPTKLGHKNWMFIGGEHTGWRSAVIYTFVEQIRRHMADPFAYFEWVFEKLMHDPSPEQLQRGWPMTKKAISTWQNLFVCTLIRTP